MPFAFMPPDEVLAALGKMVLQFGELEYWVNAGIIEGEHITDPDDQKPIHGPFTCRVYRLESAFANAKTKGWIDEVSPPIDFSQIEVVAIERNNLLHGATFTRIAKFGMPTEVHHWNINLKPKKKDPDKGRNLTKNYLDQLANRISDCSGGVQFAVLNLCLAKRQKGIDTLSGWC